MKFILGWTQLDVICLDPYLDMNTRIKYITAVGILCVIAAAALMVNQRGSEGMAIQNNNFADGTTQMQLFHGNEILCRVIYPRGMPICTTNIALSSPKSDDEKIGLFLNTTRIDGFWFNGGWISCENRFKSYIIKFNTVTNNYTLDAGGKF